VRAYFSIVKLRFAVQLQYRAAAVAGFTTQLFFGFVRVMVFHAFYASSTAVMPMTLEQVVTYTWLGQATLRMLPWNSDDEVIQLIRSGNVAYELCRPLSLYFLWYSRLISLRIVPTLLQGVPMMVLVYFFPAGFGVNPPGSFTAGAAWLLSTVFALFLGCAVSNLITVFTLWTIAGEGMQRFIPALVMILSGMIVPLPYFPDWAQDILTLLPFSVLVDIPFRFYLGLLPASDVFRFALVQSGWTVFFIITGILLIKLAMRRVVIQGG